MPDPPRIPPPAPRLQRSDPRQRRVAPGVVTTMFDSRVHTVPDIAPEKVALPQARPVTYSKDRSLLPLVAIAVLVAAALFVGWAYTTGYVSGAYVLDAASFWPVVPVAVAITLFTLPWRKVRRWALLPLLLATAIVGTVLLHRTAWEVLPSQALAVTGPGLAPEITTLDVNLDAGVVVIDEETTAALYTIAQLPGDGPLGPAEVVEQLQGDNRVLLEARAYAAGDEYLTRGWQVGLSGEAGWTITLTVEQLDADLRPLTIIGLKVSTARPSRVELPAPPADAFFEIEAAGPVTLVIPPGSAEAVGVPASVPENWTESGDLWDSPMHAVGVGYLVTILGEGVRIEEGESPA